MRGVLFLAFLMVACGGGAGSDSIVALPQRASVAVRMTQQASEDVSGYYVTFSKVSLVPESGGDPVVLFESVDGEEVNFANLDNEELLFSVNSDVATGTYTKLLVDVDSIRAVGGPCEDLDTSVPDDEIELLPEEDIEIKAGDKLVITLAMNSDQSVQIKVDGENELCVFQPVVKVEVSLLTAPEAQKCPTSANGAVTEILLSIQNDVLGFVLDLGAGSDPQNVLVNEDTGMFGTNGLPTSPDTIGLGDELTAKGRLDEDGDMVADVIIAGETITFSGTVLSMPERGVVRVMPDVGEEILGETSVRLFGETLILFDCQDATIASLTKGASVTITGKVAPDRKVFLAAEVEVDPVVIVGSLTACKEVTDGFEISVLPVGVAVEQTIFVPEEVGILLQGDGAIPKELLEDLLACEPLPVRVWLDTGDEAEVTRTLAQDTAEKKTATEVRVAAESFKGEVARIAASDQLVLVDETLVGVLRTATIIDLRKDKKLGSLEDIDIGDCVCVFGLTACEDDENVDFYGFVLVVLPCEKPQPPKPDRYEGCSHGFWKNHEDAWPAAYSPDDLFDDIFEETFPGKTLMYVLRKGGGGLHALGRETVAALLNAASDHVHYRYSEREVIAMFNETSPKGKVEALKDRFEKYNNLGCPWDGKDDDRDDEKKDKKPKKDKRNDN